MTKDAGHAGRGEFQIPDMIGTVRGYRKFRVDAEGYLTGLVYRQRWQPGTNTARCYVAKRVRDTSDSAMGAYAIIFGYGPVPASLATGNGTHRLVDGELVLRDGYELVDCPGIARSDHGCGFYARHGGCLEYEWSGSVAAVVDMWGQVELGAQGVRAERAAIVALTKWHPSPDQLERIAIKRSLIEAMQKIIDRGDRDDSFDFGLSLGECAMAQDQIDLARAYIDRIENTGKRWPLVLERYPDVPVFETETEMLAEFRVPDLKDLYDDGE